jgi:hypothetical protein
MRNLKWLPVGIAASITAGLAFAGGHGLSGSGGGCKSDCTFFGSNFMSSLRVPDLQVSNTGDGTLTSDNSNIGVATASSLAIASGPVLASQTEWPFVSVWLNGLASVQTLGGIKVGAGYGLIITNVTFYTSVVATGAGNTVLRISDGTNNCDATLSCTTVNNTTGAKAATPTGTCTFATGATLTASVQTAGCATTQPTLKNIQWMGQPQ